MKITKIDVMMMKLDPKMLMTYRPIFCRIYTDEGIYGDGEAAIAYGAGAPAAFGMIRDMAPFVLGKDPLCTEAIWETLYKKTFWGQNGGPIVYAGMAAIDMALWDIKGKFFNVPVSTLLGGKLRNRLRCYASQLQTGWENDRKAALLPEDYVRNCKLALADGYDAVKIDFFTWDRDGRTFGPEDQARLLSPYYLNLIDERASAVRETIGKNVDLIVENHSRPDANAAIQIGQMLEKYNIFYYEEPNTPSPKMTKYIRENVNIPLASGERIYGRWQYAQYFENNSLQVIQPDMGNCGGFTETKKICDMAYTYDVNVQLHVCASPLSTAAALQLESVIPNFLIHEQHVNCLTDFMKRLCVHDYQPKDGYFDVPDLPGLGNELSDFALNNSEKVVIE